jgi:nicotinate-nucleotide adenylyltransferase
MRRGEGDRERVAIFGGSFNPPHIGHSAICRWIFNRAIADEVWVVPCYIHPFAKPLVEFEHRLAMCRLAFAKLSLPISVLDIEKRLGGSSRTVRTVEKLMEENPGRHFALVTGADLEVDIEKWHRFEKLKELVEIVRIPRGAGSPIPDVSSSEIRRRIGSGEPYRDMVETEVAVYIVTKALYRTPNPNKS